MGDPTTDPISMPQARATVRGGSYFDFASQERFADRYYHGPQGQSFDTWGFRCARTLDPRQSE